LIGSFPMSLNVIYSNFVEFARISAISLNSLIKFIASLVYSDVFQNMHRLSMYDVIKMLMLDNLFVSFCRLAHGRVSMMFEIKP
jgi:hypothetical protein